MVNHNMEKIGDLLQGRLRSFGLGKAAQAARVCEVAGQIGKGDFEPISYKNGILKVKVDSDSRAHLVLLKSEEILAKINHQLERKIVHKIRFIIS